MAHARHVMWEPRGCVAAIARNNCGGLHAAYCSERVRDLDARCAKADGGNIQPFQLSAGLSRRGATVMGGAIMTSRGFTEHHSWTRPATVGFLGATTHAVWSEFVASFAQRLGERGWIDGHNIAIDYRWAHGRQDRYGKIAKDFARREVDVIVTAGTGPAIAAKKATSVIPIVFAAAGDPVGTKLVASLAHPGRNVTGLSTRQTNLAAKRLDLLRQAVPHLKRLAILGNRGVHNVRLEMEQVQKRALRLKVDTVICDIRGPARIAPAIKRLEGKADALYVCTDPLIVHHSSSINTLAAAAGLPTMHGFRDHVEAGGLMSFGADLRNMFARAADLVDKILRGTKPADIPVKEEKKTELVINLMTARALGLRIPKRLRRRAEVIR
jgi:putative ABC transport system substrate-binding protein